MKSMAMENMIETNGGKIRTRKQYMCNICGTELGAEFAIKLHCKKKHGISTCWRVVYRIVY